VWLRVLSSPFPILLAFGRASSGVPPVLPPAGVENVRACWLAAVLSEQRLLCSLAVSPWPFSFVGGNRSERTWGCKEENEAVGGGLFLSFQPASRDRLFFQQI